jgi:hypothetical protein
MFALAGDTTIAQQFRGARLRGLARANERPAGPRRVHAAAVKALSTPELQQKLIATAQEITEELERLRIDRVGPGRPRTTPDALRGDKAYSSRATRALLRSRGITAVIPEPADQQGHRKRRGSQGGDRRSSIPLTTGVATSSSVASVTSSNGEDSRPATTNSPSSTARPSSSMP